MPLGSVELASANVERVSTGIVETVRARVMGACKSDETSPHTPTAHERTHRRQEDATPTELARGLRATSVTTLDHVADWMGSHARGLPSACGIVCYLRVDIYANLPLT